jgi:dihydrofolate synthase/folylpolyglutamate synthase
VVALATAEAFFGRALHADVVDEGFAALDLPGRFEVVNRSPLVVIDAAHNAAGLAATAETFADEFTVIGRSIALVGLLAGRDPEAAIAAVAGSGAERLVAVRPDSPRALDPREVAALGRAAGMETEVIDDPAVAFRTTLDRMADDDALLVTGSFYVAGTVRATARLLGLLD